MWLTLGALFFAGTTIGAFSLLLPHPSQFDDRAIWSNIGIACLASLVCALGSRRLPAWSAQLAAVGGTVVITRAVFYSHDPSFYSFFYVWVGLFAFYFFGREWGVRPHGPGGGPVRLGSGRAGAERAGGPLGDDRGDRCRRGES